MKIKTFIFDLDGVITNTAKYHYLAWKKIADENNIPFGEKENDILRGVSRHESLELLLGENIKMYTTDDFNQMLIKKISIIKLISKKYLKVIFSRDQKNYYWN